MGIFCNQSMIFFVIHEVVILIKRWNIDRHQDYLPVDKIANGDEITWNYIFLKGTNSSGNDDVGAAERLESPYVGTVVYIAGIN